MMKTFQILFCMTAFLLSACHAKVDNTFNESSLNHELDSITQVILNENMQAQFAKADYTPNDKDVDRCVEICDTLIAHGVVPNPIMTKLRILSVAKRYKECIEFGNSEICSSNEVYPVPGLLKCKLNAMQCRLDGDKEGEEKCIKLAFEHINQYICKNKTVFDDLLKMNKESFESAVVTNYKSNQPYVKAMMTIMLYEMYYACTFGNDAWNKEYERLCKEYPDAFVLATMKSSVPSTDIMSF